MSKAKAVKICSLKHLGHHVGNEIFVTKLSQNKNKVTDYVDLNLKLNENRWRRKITSRRGAINGGTRNPTVGIKIVNVVVC